MVAVTEYFVPLHHAPSVSEEEYERADIVIRSFEALSRMTYQSLYIIDHFKKNFLFVSENPLFLRGYSSEEVKKLGYLFYIRHVPEKEQSMLVEINRSVSCFFHGIPANEKLLYTISYDFHIQTEGKEILVNHKLTPITLDKEGRIWLAACMVSLSSHKNAGHIEMRKAGQNNYWTYSLKQHRWQECEGIGLSQKEQDILILSAKGCTMNEIADKLCMATDTVKYHKRKIFERMKVKSITEALSFATNNKLL